MVEVTIELDGELMIDCPVVRRMPLPLSLGDKMQSKLTVIS
jgi:hypothetical protein